MTRSNLLRLLLAVILIGYGLFAWWLFEKATVAADRIIQAETILVEPSPIPEAIVRFDGSIKGLVIPSWQWLNHNNIWAYASPSQSIDLTYQPDLVDITVSHGDWLVPKQIAQTIEQPLADLFEAAQASGHPLIITSAYRSATEQQELLTDYLGTMGTAWTHAHVSQPGHSEHQLGLAIDMSSMTSACQADFSGCQLSNQTASWLKDNAHKHGFILRYPKDKADITGISYEPWHYRYVGKRAAEIITVTGLSFDEFIDRLTQERTAR